MKIFHGLLITVGNSLTLIGCAGLILAVSGLIDADSSGRLQFCGSMQKLLAQTSPAVQQSAVTMHLPCVATQHFPPVQAPVALLAV